MSVAFVVYLTLCHILRDMRSETIMNLPNGRLSMGGRVHLSSREVDPSMRSAGSVSPLGSSRDARYACGRGAATPQPPLASQVWR